MSRSTFIAAYDGQCDNCAFTIDAGDEIGYGPDHDLLCADCHSDVWLEMDGL